MKKGLFVLTSAGFFLLVLSSLALAAGCGCKGGCSGGCGGGCGGGCAGADGCQAGAQSCSDPKKMVASAVTGNTQAVSPEKEAGQAAAKEPVNAGNKICPVMSGKVDGKTTYEYEGKIYNFCCPGCIAEFQKDPEKYIKIVEEGLKSGKT